MENNNDTANNAEMIAKYLKLAQQRREANNRYYHNHKELVASKSKVKYDENKDTISAKRKEKYNLKKDDEDFKEKNRISTRKQYEKKRALKLEANVIETYVVADI
jgi:hypothetical protein